MRDHRLKKKKNSTFLLNPKEKQKKGPERNILVRGGKKSESEVILSGYGDYNLLEWTRR